MKPTLMVVILLIAMPVQAQLSGEYAHDNLAMDGWCRPMGLEVQTFGDAADDVSLRSALQDLVESRLRFARLYAEDGWNEWGQVLLVFVSAIDTAFNLEVNLMRFVMDTGSGKQGSVLVWNLSTLGVNSRVNFPLADLVGQFITEYVRANPACERE